MKIKEAHLLMKFNKKIVLSGNLFKMWSRIESLHKKNREF